jgi:putative Mn2+ efflux pump MntP
MLDTFIYSVDAHHIMDAVTIVLIAIGLAMDAFAVSISKGLAMKTPTLKAILVIGLWFGGFQAIMPIIGYCLGSSFYQYVSSYGYWIAFALLMIIGLNMIREALSGDEEDVDASIGPKTMLILAVATSIDAFAVGVSLSMENAEILVSAAIIGVITMAISMAGVLLGNVIGDILNRKAGVIGGVILIIIGIKIIVENSGVR